MAGRLKNRIPGVSRKVQRATEREARSRRHREYVQKGMTLYAPNVPDPGPRRTPTDEDLEKILELIAEGDTLRDACKRIAVVEGTIRNRLLDEKAYYPRYVRARELQAEALADMLRGVAEEDVDYEARGAGNELNHRKLKFETYRWLMAKNHVRRFGDRVILEGGDKPIRTVREDMTDEQAVEVYREMVRDGKGREEHEQ